MTNNRSVEVPFRAPRGVGGAHAQTLWAYLGQSAPTVQYHRERMETPDGDFVDLDWLGDREGQSPLLVVLHGLEGNAKAPYIRRLAAMAREQGWSAVALNARGCSGHNNRKVHSYHAAWTADLEHVIDTLVAREPERSLGLVGYSLGGSQVGNYLGRKGESVPQAVRAAFIVSSPLSLTRAIGRLGKGFNRVYSSKFMQTLRWKLIQKAWAHPEARKQAIRGVLTGSVRGFDSAWTAPVNGYESSDHYYEQSSCENWLEHISVPTHILHAKDDPLIPWNAVIGPWQERAKSITLLWTQVGGHVGFVHAENSHWLEEQIVRGLRESGIEKKG